ncbi:MAG: hypothetical protein ACI8ZB_004952 [Desulforhopalus sp.]
MKQYAHPENVTVTLSACGTGCGVCNMSYISKPSAEPCVTTFDEFVRLADFFLMDTLNADPDAAVDGDDHRARQVFYGHFVPVKLTPL